MARSGSLSHAAHALEAYELWADTYAPEPHNPLMAAEQNAMLGLLPAVRGARVLDLACGTGRYSRLLAAAQASFVVALDLSPAMLRRASNDLRVLASMDRLPFAQACFDVVVSGLAIGHGPDLGRWMDETARVLAPGGTLLYSDFHPVASQRGLQRTFKDRADHVHTIAHCCHTVDAQRAAAVAAGLTVEHVLELRAGIEFVETFDGADAFYRREHGTPLVLVVRARKPTVRRPRSRARIGATVGRPRSRPTSSAAGRREPIPGGSGRDIPVADGPPRKIPAGIIGRVDVGVPVGARNLGRDRDRFTGATDIESSSGSPR